MTQNLDLDLEPDLADPRLGDLHAVTIALDPRQAEELGAAASSLCMSFSKDDESTSTGWALERHGVLFESPKRLVVALGVAGRLPLPHGTSDVRAVRAVSRRLAEIGCEDPVCRPGSSVMALGALAFDPYSPGELVIPQVTFVRDEDGLSWITIVGTPPLDIPDLRELESRLRREELASRLLREQGAATEPRRWPVETGMPGVPPGAVLVESGDAEFVDAVRTALGEIAAGRMEKVVLARKVVVDFEVPIDVDATVAALRRRERSSTIFAVTSPGHAFVGASPELLVVRDGPIVRSVPLAGTVRMSGNAASDESAVARLVASTKENLEHRLVVDIVAAQLAQWCPTLRVPDVPEVLWLRQIAHLATPMYGQLEGDPDEWPTALELAAALHPTPAVGGAPGPASLAIIGKLEPKGRGLYAGPVGWVDARGNGQFVIGIRSSEVTRSSASVYAGAGIVAGSDPSDELAETSFKLDTMLGALGTR